MTSNLADPVLVREVKAVLKLAVPVAVAQVGMMALGVEDVIMVGRVSGEALAAVALGNLYTLALMVLGQGILLSLDPLVAQAHGKSDRPEIERSFQRGLVLSLVLSAPFSGIFAVAEPVLRALHQPPEAVPIAAQYAHAITPGVPAFFLFVVLRQSLQAMSIVRPVLIAVLLGNACNVLLNWILIYGRLGVPAMGAVGSAWSTTISRWVMAVGLAAAAWPVLRTIWRRPDRALLAPGPYWRMLRIGTPIGVQIALEVWVFMTAGLLVGTMGSSSLSGHQIALNLASVSFMVPLGIGAAAATRVGNAIGRRDPSGARRSAIVSLSLGALVMTLSAVAFAAFPRALARIYSHDADVIETAAKLLPIAAIFQVFDGTQAVGCGVLRGAGDTRAAAIINLVGYWVIALPLGAWLAFTVRLEARGLWWGLTAGLFLVAIALVIRIHRTFLVRAD